MARRLKTTVKDRKTLEKALELFRQAEKREDLATIVDDHEAIRLISAWGGSGPIWKRPKRARPRADLELNTLWRWLWEGVHFDREELAARARLDESRAHQLLRACVGAFALYPDGSISQPATELLEEYTRQRWPGRVRGRPKGSADRGERTKGESDEENTGD